MKVTNATDYDTRQLRTVLTRVHNQVAKKRGRLRWWKRLTVNVTYRRQGNRKYTGHAYLRGTYSHLSVPRGGLNTAAFAALWSHELLHLYGVMHGDMNQDQLYCRITPALREAVNGLPEAFAERVKASKPKPTAEQKDDVKVSRLVERQRAWQTKLKRAQTALRKIDKSLRYYDKKRAARPQGEDQ